MAGSKIIGALLAAPEAPLELWQQFLALRPLPQEHGSFRPTVLIASNTFCYKPVQRLSMATFNTTRHQYIQLISD